MRREYIGRWFGENFSETETGTNAVANPMPMEIRPVLFDFSPVEGWRSDESCAA